MKRVIVYCEGPTEETFVKRILAPSLYSKSVFLVASPCKGVSKYSIIKKELSDLCKNDTTAIITTMLDYYGIPSETPGMSDCIGGTIYDRIRHVEESIRADIGTENLIPNLVLHEFEALLFSAPEHFSYCALSAQKIGQLCDIRRDVQSPEFINNDPNTTPSKRILNIYPQYNKVLDGYNIAQDIGLAKIRQECVHFDEWVKKLESLGK